RAAPEDPRFDGGAVQAGHLRSRSHDLRARRRQRSAPRRAGPVPGRGGAARQRPGAGGALLQGPQGARVTRAAALALALLSSPGALAPPKPGRAALKTLAAAETLFARADYEAASARFGKALALSPGWKTAAGYRALCRWVLADAAAGEDAKLALQLKPN